MRKFCIIILIISLLWLFRTEIFNLLIRYEVESEIPLIELRDQYWIDEVKEIVKSNQDLGIVAFNDKVLELVTSKLKFGKEQIVSNPNNFRESIAHCVGCAALNSTLLEYNFKSSTYEISHVRGKIY